MQILEQLRRTILVTFALAAFSLCACSAPASESTTAPAGSSSEAVTTEESTSSEDQQTSAGTDVYTAYVDYEPAPQQPIETVPGTNSDVLIAYFSHAANTSLSDSGADAVTSASIMVQDDGTVVGNAQLMADWIAESTGGDLFAIQTAYSYPHDYDDLVAVGEGQDRDGVLPELLMEPTDIEQYSYVYLVYPVWHFAMPAPVRSFLQDNDLNGKTILAFATNSGSSFGSSIDEIEQYEPDATVIEGISVRQNDVEGAEKEVKDAVAQLMAQTGETPNETAAATSDAMNTTMTITIGNNAFTATLADTEAAREFAALMENGPVSIDMTDYSGFEKVGPIGQTLTANNSEITTAPGDIMLYQGNKIVMFYGENTWEYTPIGKVDDLTGWDAALGSGEITAVFSFS